MDYEKMTRDQMLRELQKNEVLKPVKEMDDISFGHVNMVEKIGKALVGNPHSFGKIINATVTSTGLTITIPKVHVRKLFDLPAPSDADDCDGCCDTCDHGQSVIGECGKVNY